jgi:hypothetical protein
MDIDMIKKTTPAGVPVIATDGWPMNEVPLPLNPHPYNLPLNSHLYNLTLNPKPYNLTLNPDPYNSTLNPDPYDLTLNPNPYEPCPSILTPKT